VSYAQRPLLLYYSDERFRRSAVVLATPMIRTGKAGFMGKREPQMILKTDERSIVLELGHEGTFVAQIKRLRSKPAFRRGDKLEVAVKNGR
jgi:hypothetical protein